MRIQRIVNLKGYNSIYGWSSGTYSLKAQTVKHIEIGKAGTLSSANLWERKRNWSKKLKMVPTGQWSFLLTTVGFLVIQAAANYRGKRGASYFLNFCLNYKIESFAAVVWSWWLIVCLKTCNTASRARLAPLRRLFWEWQKMMNRQIPFSNDWHTSH